MLWIRTTRYSVGPANSSGPKLSVGDHVPGKFLIARHRLDEGSPSQIGTGLSSGVSKQLYGLAPADDRALLLDERGLALGWRVVRLPDVVTALDSGVVSTLALRKGRRLPVLRDGVLVGPAERLDGYALLAVQSLLERDRDEAECDARSCSS